jgi:hypothetical protein
MSTARTQKMQKSRSTSSSSTCQGVVSREPPEDPALEFRGCGTHSATMICAWNFPKFCGRRSLVDELRMADRNIVVNLAMNE